MKKYNVTYLREELEALPTYQLDSMLRKELQKTPPNGDNVRLILSVLEARENDSATVPGEEIQAAWEDYQLRAEAASRRPSAIRQVAQVAAALVIVLLALVVVPQEVDARGIFDRLIRWTDSVFELLSPGDTRVRPSEYVFETDHPGLQEVHDALVELGVTDPVVPMWLPEGYELTECGMTMSPSKTGVTARFSDGTSSIILVADIYTTNESCVYYRDSTTPKIYEINGITHHIMRNENRWVAIWTRDNLECSVSIDCQEEILYQILRSIYEMEDE